MVDITCRHCSIIFRVPRHRAATAKYCSRSCLAHGAKVQIVANCGVCGVEFEHISSRANKAKYCSRSCYYKAMHLKGSVTVSCAHCEKTFCASPSQNRKYCSRQCINKAKHTEWSPAFTTVRKALVARNAITACQRCGYDAEPRILGIHHKDHNRRNNARDNLIVLCPNCHSLAHMKHIAHASHKQT